MKEIRYTIQKLIGNRGDEWMDSSVAISTESTAKQLAQKWAVDEGRIYRVVRTTKIVETNVLCQYDKDGNVRYGE